MGGGREDVNQTYTRNYFKAHWPPSCKFLDDSYDWKISEMFPSTLHGHDAVSWNKTTLNTCIVGS